MKVNRSALMKFLKETGQEHRLAEIKHGESIHIKLTPTDVKEINERLTAGHVVVLRPMKNVPGKWEFVGENYVTIAPRRHYEKHPPTKREKTPNAEAAGASAQEPKETQPEPQELAI